MLEIKHTANLTLLQIQRDTKSMEGITSDYVMRQLKVGIFYHLYAKSIPYEDFDSNKINTFRAASSLP